ncbi:SH3 domain-containing protein [Lentinula raphanica]|nr:SH3 domain-containing protein [Lentinula raphanica]
MLPVDSEALVQHLIAQTRSNISFLISQHQIAPNVGREILDRLPNAGPSIPDPVTALSEQASNIHISGSSSPPPPVAYGTRDYPPTPVSVVKAKALWGYNEGGEDPQDLSFRAGDIIEIVQETNPDWWTGRFKGREGLFPATYVEKLPPSSPLNHSRPLGSPAAPNPTYSYAPPTGPPGPGSNGYGPPPSGYYQSPPPPQGYSPYPYAPPGPPQPGPVVMSASAPPAPMEQPKKSKFGGMGNTLATAAVGGLGFGAGSAIGADVVNSIF